MSFDAYKIAVKISLVNNVTSGLMAMSQQFNKVHGNVTALQTQLDKIKVTMMAGAGLSAAGAFGLGMIGKTVGPAKEYAHQLALMNVAGMKHLDIVKATNAAWAASKNAPTSSASENLASIRELRMVFGDTGHAIENMPVVQQLQAVLRDVRGGGHGRDEAYEVAKALEMKGAVRTPEQFRGQADMMTKAIIASGGKVGASDFLGTFKYGRSATAGWSDDFTYTVLPTLIQEMKTAGGSGGGGGGPGNALMSAYAAVVGGTIPQKSLKVWEKLGLLDSSKIIWDKVGGAKGVAPGGVMGSADFQANPYKWTQDYLVPALKAAGYTTDEQQKQMLQYLFPNRTAGFVMSQMTTQAWKFERDKKIIGGTSGLSAYNALLKSDPEMAAMALHKQWESLLSIIGYQIMPMLVSGSLKLISLLRSLAELFRNHQTLVKSLVIAFGGLSIISVVAGGVLMLGAGLVGLKLALGAGGGLAAMLRSVALGFGGVGMTLGKAGLLGAVGVAAYSAATALGADDLGSWIGGKAYDLLHPGESTVKPGASSKAPVNVVVKADHRGFSAYVAGNLAKHQMGAMGSGTFDLGVAAPTMNMKTP